VSIVEEVTVREWFEGSEEEFNRWVRSIDSKYPKHDLQRFRFTFYTNWFNVVAYWIHEYILKSREKIKNEIEKQLEELKLEPVSVIVDVESEGWNRRFRIEVEARKKRVLTLGAPMLLRIITILPRVVSIVLRALMIVLATIIAILGITLIISFIQGFVEIITWIAREAERLGNIVALALLALAGYVIYREVRRK
jgi:hypothetical protein